MSKFPLSPMNASIAIYLDPANDRESPEPRELPEYTCPTCETSSRDSPIHCISHASPAPPSYSAISPQGTSIRSTSSRNLTVPTLNIETSQGPTKPLRPVPALQFDPEGRPRVRFRRNAFSPLSPNTQHDNITWSRKSAVGLGIPDAQFMPDTSPVTPGTVERAGEKSKRDLEGASNFAQRIEQKLWKYSASGNVVKRWLLEIISWCISAICMAGIIIMLFVYKGDRIPKWPLGLTINAYISVLSKVASAALLLPVSEALGQLKWSWFRGDNSKKMWDFEIFDNASRGPWGSMLLLVRTKGKSLAALGAAVTIFALALDPFFQQVVEYPETWRLQEGSGSIPRAVAYEPYQTGKEYRVGLESIELDKNVAGIAHRYFYDNGIPPTAFGKGARAEIPLACPSSNCTWPQYETIGVCSKCIEASDQLEFRCLNTTLDWVQDPEADPETGNIVLRNGTSCGWYLKTEPPLLMTGYNIDRDTPFAGEILKMRAQPLYDIFTRERLSGFTSKLQDVRNPIAHFVVASGDDRDNILRNATPITNECIISWCVKTMLSSYLEGVYSENITNTFINHTVGPSPWTTREIMDEAGIYIGDDFQYNENITLRGENGTEYHINNFTQVVTLTLFDDIFPSTYSLSNSTNDEDAMMRNRQFVVMNPYTRNLTYNPWLYPNITSHLDRLANAITNVIRSSPKSTVMLPGPAYDMDSIVDVRWIWLTLPLGLLTLTFIFLVATVIRSSLESEHVGVWKTSAIATLLFGLPDDMQKKITSSKDIGTPRAKAKQMKVKWLPRAGWRFSGNSSSPVSAKGHATSPSSFIASPSTFKNVMISPSSLKASPSGFQNGTGPPLTPTDPPPPNKSGAVSSFPPAPSPSIKSTASSPPPSFKSHTTPPPGWI